MKRAVILHGTDNDPGILWNPWLKQELEKSGYQVFSPVLPNNHTPNREVYEKFLRGSGWDFSDNLIIGHSSGATTILNLLSSDWFPKVKTVVLVGTFLSLDLLEDVDWYEPGQFDGLFLDGYNPKNIARKADRFIFVHGSDDPYCDITLARKLCEELSGEFITIQNGHHLGGSSGVSELPQLLDRLVG
ncbi:MAG: RBBP9/YdeN family alpha/beta hydrolase [Candidatus Saccharimonadales bacterium]